MKLIIHAALFAAGTVEVDTATGEHRFLTDPLINADQSITADGSEAIPQDIAMATGAAALAVLNKAIGQWILKQAGIDAKVVASKKEPIPLVNVVGKASA